MSPRNIDVAQPYVPNVPSLFAPLMQRPTGVDAEAWLRQCVNRAQQVPMDETRKASYLADLAILSGLKNNLVSGLTLP